MTRPALNRSRWMAVGASAAVLASAAVPMALADDHGTAGSPTRADTHGVRSHGVTTHEPPNVDLVKNQVAAYYGDPDKTGHASRHSGYGYDMARVERSMVRTLRQRQHWGYGKDHKTVLLDVDDTTLLTYNYEIASNFAYDPAENAKWVLGEKFRSTFGMVQVVRKAKRWGYDVIYLTGRPESQEAATVGNLRKAGYPKPDAIYTKPANPPAYLTCGTSCTTIEFKSLTRKHINSTGQHIVLNAGDQFSDLAGGQADTRFKLPNPMYYLP